VPKGLSRKVKRLPQVSRAPPCRWQLSGSPTLDWQSFLAKKNAELSRLNGVYMNLLNGSKVDVSLGGMGFVC
jgi:hypothetical protein